MSKSIIEINNNSYIEGFINDRYFLKYNGFIIAWTDNNTIYAKKNANTPDVLKWAETLNINTIYQEV